MGLPPQTIKLRPGRANTPLGLFRMCDNMSHVNDETAIFRPEFVDAGFGSITVTYDLISDAAVPAPVIGKGFPRPSSIPRSTRW